MFKDSFKDVDPDPHQGPSLFRDFTTHSKTEPASSGSQNGYTVALLGSDDIPAFLALQKKVMDALPEDQKHFLKPRSEEDLEAHIGARMPLIGVKDSDGALVAQCIVAYPRHADAVKNLEGYPINGTASVTTIVQSLSVDPDHGKKGLSQMILDTAKDLSAMAGHTRMLAKVADDNKGSTSTFIKGAFTAAAHGVDVKKGYPVTYWQYPSYGAPTPAAG